MTSASSVEQLVNSYFRGNGRIDKEGVYNLIVSSSDAVSSQTFDKIVASIQRKVQKIEHPCSRAEVQASIVRALAQVSRFSLAREIASGIVTDFWQAEAWIDIVESSRKEADVKKAYELVEKITEPHLRAQALEDIADLEEAS